MSVIEKYPNAFFGLLCAMLLVMAGCGGGGGSSAPAAADNGNATVNEEGKIIIGITDAPGDFVGYSVDVLSLTLTRSNGDIVETLPNTTRIDFNELTDVTEFLTIATVPAGVYDSATITLDYSSAEILVQDEFGNAEQADAQDADGNPVGVLPMNFSLSGSDVIRIQAGIPAAFSVDFDLDASNTIDHDVSPALVTVEPFLLATAQLEEDREHRARGVLAEVNTEDETFTLRVRPFHHRIGEFGELTVAVNADTQYEVDGAGYTGSAGLEAMLSLADRAPVLTQGQVSEGDYTANVVVAGSSVPWSDTDVIRGVVVSRDADSLNVRGAFAHKADGDREFRGSYVIQVNADTVVSAPGFDSSALSQQSVSVGQPIWVWGEAVDDNTLAAERIRMTYAQLTGGVVETTPLVTDLHWLNGRRPDIYDFSGTGINTADDADPNAYDIDTATLALTSVEPGDLVRVRGLVNEFAAAPADFLAKTVIDIQTDLRSAQLWVGWPEGSTTPFASTAPARIDVNLMDARVALKMRGVPMDFVDLEEQVSLLAPASGNGVYAVKLRGSGEIRLFRQFADLVDALVAELDAGHRLHRITAQGRYNNGQSELTTGRAGFVFTTDQQPE